MAAHPAVHPSEDALRALALGKATDAVSAVILSHLDGCPDCCKFVAALSGDDFLNRLRRAHGRSVTPPPAKALPDAAPAERQPAGQTPIPNLPPELAANPQYEILRELGRGGMGVVYLAKNRLMDRLEVLKVINKTLLDRPGAVERFLREIRSAAKLSHANVVGAYSALQVGELLAFAMEYVEGQDLASVVKSQGSLPLIHACYYVQQAAHGLQHAFENRMVHRDIKPQNLILARKGKKHIIKVLDFGLAKATSEKRDDLALTGVGRMLGTPDYMAPEQSLDAAKADIRADIYSLGCTLYYLLSGRPPFIATSLSAVLLAHQMQEAKPLNLVRPEVPEELAAVVRKMMAKTPAKRYQTPSELVQALAPFIRPASGAASAPRGTPKASLELSMGVTEAKPAIPQPARIDPPTPPVAEPVKKQSEQANVWASLTEEDSAPVVPRKSRSIRKLQPSARGTRKQKKWLSYGVPVGGVLLLVLAGLWASGVFRKEVRTEPQENPDKLNAAAWEVVKFPEAGKEAYAQALHQAEKAVKLAPYDGNYLNTLGVAQYRMGLYAEALATLNTSEKLNGTREGSKPVDLAFLAMVQCHLGKKDKAKETLGRLREVMKQPRWATDTEARNFRDEAEEETTEDPAILNTAAWRVAKTRDADKKAYARALRLAETLVRLAHGDGNYLNTLGVAQYRTGRYAVAVATLTRSEKLNATARGPAPSDLAFLAMAQYHLGKKEEAKAMLSRLREIMKQPRWANDEEKADFLREAEELIEGKGL